MVRPAAFGFDDETAATNVFQHAPSPDASGDQTSAIQKWGVEEFDGLVLALIQAGVEVIVVDDTPEPGKLDAVFPCNWISFHADGTVILYPISAPVRRLERRPSIIRDLETNYGFQVSRVVDLTSHEREGRFLEGSGSLVFDDANRLIYASLSDRTNPDLAADVADLLGYELVTFAATDERGRPIYHTDVVMALGTGFGVVAAEAIREEGERQDVLDRLRSTGRELVQISFEQLALFAGNLLEVTNRDGGASVVMSDAAYAALAPDQLEAIGRYGALIHAPLPTIEGVGGGSARCMIADIHLLRVSSGGRR